MYYLDTKAKNYIFKSIINGCDHNKLKSTPSFDKDGNIVNLLIENGKMKYNISDIGFMGITLLVKEDYNGTTTFWGIRELLQFIISNKWGGEENE